MHVQVPMRGIGGGEYWAGWEKSAVGSRSMKRAGRLYREPLLKRLVTENQGALTRTSIRDKILCKA